MNNEESEIQFDLDNIKEPQTENSSDNYNDIYSEEEVIQNDEDEGSNREEEETLSEVKPQRNQKQQKPNQPIELHNKATSENKLNKGLTLKKESKNKPITQLALSNKETDSIDNTRGSKTVFTQITENIFNQYITIESKRKHQPKIYDILLSDTYVSKLKEQTKAKDNKIKFTNMLKRHHQYSDSMNLKHIQRQEKEEEHFKLMCTFKPNSINRVISINNKSRKRNPSEFYLEQQMHANQRDEMLQKLKEDKELNQKKIMSLSPKISIKSTQIAESRYSRCSNRTESDVFNRLHTSKSKSNQANKIKDVNINQTLSPKSKTIRQQDRVYKYANKLHEQKSLMKTKREEKRKQNLAEVTQRNNDMTTQSTKKVLLHKLLDSFGQERLGMINNDKMEISYKEYCLIMNQIGFVSNSNVDNDNDNNYNEEQQLLRSSFEKYINQQKGINKMNYCLLFALTVMGIYKDQGKDKIQSQESIRNQSVSPSNKSYSTQKQQSLSKLTISNLDFNTYYYSTDVANKIRLAYSSLYNNLSCHWATQSSIKKQKRNGNNKSLSTSNEKERTKDNKVKHSFKKSKTKSLTKRVINLHIEDLNIDPHNIRKLKIEDAYKYYQQFKNKELNYLKEKKLQEEIKECTFQPNAYSKKVSKNVLVHIEKLYNENKANLHKKQCNEELKHRERKELSECTFKPMTYSLNTEMFNNNPLFDDVKLKKELELREQARMNKNIVSCQLKKGFTTTSFSDLNLLYCIKTNTESTPLMRFDIEQKTSKDTFNYFKSHKNKYNYREKKNHSIYTKREKNIMQLTPKLIVEINIDDNNKGVKLVIYKGDDPIKVTDDFCAKYMLSDEKKEQIQSIIQNKLSKIT